MQEKKFKALLAAIEANEDYTPYSVNGELTLNEKVNNKQKVELINALAKNRNIVSVILNESGISTLNLKDEDKDLLWNTHITNIDGVTIPDESFDRIKAWIDRNKLLADVASGAKPIDTKTTDGSTALMYAAQGGDIDKVKLLLDRGANVNTKGDKHEMTALMFAVLERHPEVVKHLLEKGANINAKSAKGYTALMSAARDEGNLEVVKCLLERGANIDAEDAYGYTALMRAVKNKCIDIVKWLLDQGAKVDSKSKTNKDEGYTALTYAVKWGNLEIVKSLLAKRAEQGNKDTDELKMALEIADKKEEDIVAALISAHPSYQALMARIDIIISRMDEEGQDREANLAKRVSLRTIRAVVKAGNSSVEEIYDFLKAHEDRINASTGKTRSGFLSFLAPIAVDSRPLLKDLLKYLEPIANSKHEERKHRLFL